MARGSILKRKRVNGTVYMARVEYDPDPASGKRRQRSETFPTRKAAEKRLSAWLGEIDRGTVVEPSKVTVAELFAAWFDDVATHTVRPSTLDGYKLTERLHIRPDLGRIPVQRLTASDVQAFYARKLKAGVSPRTVQLCHLRLSQALKQAVRWSWITANPCLSVDPPRVTYKRGNTWNSDQLRRFLGAATDDGLHPLWTVLATTGMRRGEALGLRWRDVDLDRGTVTINQSVIAKTGAPEIVAPKTDAGRRTITLTPDTTKALREYRPIWASRKLAAPPELWQDTDLVFCTSLGRPINPNNITRNFERIIAGINAKLPTDAPAEMKLPRIRVHDLRHTHATLLINARVPITAISQRLGHANVSITLNTYSHLLPETQDLAAATFAALLTGGPAEAGAPVSRASVNHS